MSDAARNLVKTAHARLVADLGHDGPAVRWLAPRVALEMARRGLAEQWARFNLAVTEAVAAGDRLRRAVDRGREGHAALIIRLRNQARAAHHRAIDERHAVDKWILAMEELARIRARSTGAACLACGTVYVSEPALAAHTCAGSPYDLRTTYAGAT